MGVVMIAGEVERLKLSEVAAVSVVHGFRLVKLLPAANWCSQLATKKTGSRRDLFFYARFFVNSCREKLYAHEIIIGNLVCRWLY